MNPWIVSIITILVIILIKGLLLCVYYFRCPNCHHIFKPKFYQVMLEAHFGEEFIIKCPFCKTRGRKKILVKDKKIFHQMKLNDSPFNLIKQGKKTIELRLNDEKRQLINIGDRILFTNNQTLEQMVCLVEELYHFDNFVDLYKEFDKISLGYLENEISDPSDMLEYYKEEDINRYKVLGIQIRKIM